MKRSRKPRVRGGERQTLEQFLRAGGQIKRVPPARAGTGRFDAAQLTDDLQGPWACGKPMRMREKARGC